MDEGPGQQPEIGPPYRGPRRRGPVDLDQPLEGRGSEGHVDRRGLSDAGLDPGEVRGAGEGPGGLRRGADRGIAREAARLQEPEGRLLQLSAGPADAPHREPLDLPPRPGDDADPAARRPAAHERPRGLLRREGQEGMIRYKTGNDLDLDGLIELYRESTL